MIGLKMKAFPRGFSNRHLAILRLLAKGMDQYQIARELRLAVSTVRRYRFDMLKALGVNNSTRAVAIGYENGWIEEEAEAA